MGIAELYEVDCTLLAGELLLLLVSGCVAHGLHVALGVVEAWAWQVGVRHWLVAAFLIK